MTLGSPFLRRHSRARGLRGHNLKLVHQPLYPRQPKAETPRCRKSVAKSLRDIQDAGSFIIGNQLNALPGRAVNHCELDLPGLGVGDDIPRQLRDGGSDQGGIPGAEAQRSRQRTALLTGRYDVLIRIDRNVDLVFHGLKVSYALPARLRLNWVRPSSKAKAVLR